MNVHYSMALLTALGTSIKHQASGVEFNAVDGTHDYDAWSGMHSKRFRDDRGQEYTVTVTPVNLPMTNVPMADALDAVAAIMERKQ